MGLCDTSLRSLGLNGSPKSPLQLGICAGAKWPTLKLYFHGNDRNNYKKLNRSLQSLECFGGREEPTGGTKGSFNQHRS